MAQIIISFLQIVLKITSFIDKLVISKVKYLFSQAYWKNELRFLGKKVFFGKNVIIRCGYNVSIGNKSGIGDFVMIWGAGGVTIGEDVLIATHCVITSQGHSVNSVKYNQSQVMKAIVIEDNVWLGAGVIVMPGITIGKNSIIGAGSVVTKNIPANCIAFGNPAKVNKEIIKTE